MNPSPPSPQPHSPSPSPLPPSPLPGSFAFYPPPPPPPPRPAPAPSPVPSARAPSPLAPAEPPLVGVGVGGGGKAASAASPSSSSHHHHHHHHPHLSAPTPPRPSPPPPPPPPPPAKKILDLPKISFRIVEDGRGILNGKKDGRRDGVFSETSRAYGYNDSADFERPEHYIRHIEPIESELKNQVEYDMDEQDQEWLDDLNRERKKEQSDPISYELFEIVMDRFEKEWFDLTKLIPNTKASLPSEDSPCGVCDDGEGENSNAIVFCDGCNLAVHQDCYGVPYIPEGQWLCRKCTVSPENPVSCVLCPAEGGAFKQTSSGQWAHLLCAIWIPEVGVGNSVYMEPIDGIENVPKSRWKLPCSICKQKGGACIQCDSKTCYTAFHVSCGRENGLLGSMKTMGEGHGPGGGDGVLRGWCEKHVPNEVLSLHAQRHPHSAIAARLAQAPSSSSSSNSHKKGASGRGGGAVQAVVIKKTKKSARAYAKTYLPPPPLVPAKILGDIAEYVARMPGRKKKELIELVGRYWSLKREARRGAPLLKRLHLEPWTASGARVHTEAEKAKKMEYLVRVRNDLEKVRMLAELVRKREKEKLRQAQIYKQVLDSVLFPHDTALRLCMEKISSQDRTEVFLHPVSRIDVPDYHEVIKKPMAWETIEEKLENHHYVNVQEFQDDINLVFDNAQLYNDPESAIHKLAVRLQKAAAPFLAELDPIKTAPSSVSSLLQIPPSDIASAATSTAGPTSFADILSTLSHGDLEPALELLSILTEVDDPSDPSSIDPLTSLFNFEILRTPPPSPRRPAPEPELAPEPEPEPVIEPAPAPAEIEVDAEGEADAEGEPDEEEVEALAPAAVLPPSPPPPPPPALAPFEVDVDMEEPAPAPEAPPKGRKPWDPVKDKERRALRAAEKEAAKVERRKKKLAKAAELKAAAEVEINNEVEVGEGGGGDQLEAGPSVVVVVASTEPQEQPVEAYSPEASSTRATRTRAARTSITSLAASPPPPPPPPPAEEEQPVPAEEEEAPVAVAVEEEAPDLAVEPEVEVEHVEEGIVVASGSGAAEKKPSSRKRKRPTSDGNMDSDVPLAVAELDNRDTFKMFETGWILPEGSRRGGRTAEPRESSPVKAKRQRIKKVEEAAVEEVRPAAAEAPIPDQPMEIDEPPPQPEAGPSRLRDAALSPSKHLPSESSALSVLANSEMEGLVDQDRDDETTVADLTLPSVGPFLNLDEANESLNQPEGGEDLPAAAEVGSDEEGGVASAQPSERSSARSRQPRKAWGTPPADESPAVKRRGAPRQSRSELDPVVVAPSSPPPAPEAEVDAEVDAVEPRSKGKGRAKAVANSTPAGTPSQPKRSRTRQSTGGATATPAAEEVPVASSSKIEEEEVVEPTPAATPSQPKSSRSRKSAGGTGVPAAPVEEDSVASSSEKKEKEKEEAVEAPVVEIKKNKGGRSRKSIAGEPPVASSSSLPLPVAATKPSRKGKEKAQPEPEPVVEDVVMEEPAVETTKKGSRSKGKGKGKAKGKEDVEVAAAKEVKKVEDPDFIHGTVVWVKTLGYPWFPAQLVVPEEVDSDDEEIHPPDKVLDDKARHLSGTNELFLVRFFDKQQSWAWVQKNQMQLLGEDKAVDDKMILQKFRVQGHKSAFRAAYQQCLSEVLSDGGDDKTEG